MKPSKTLSAALALPKFNVYVAMSTGIMEAMLTDVPSYKTIKDFEKSTDDPKLDIDELQKLAVDALSDDAFAAACRNVLVEGMEIAAELPFAVPPFHHFSTHISDAVVLSVNPNIILTVERLSRSKLVAHKKNPENEARSVSFSGLHTHLRILNNANVSAKRWRMTERLDENWSPSTIGCEIAEAIDVVPGEVYSLDGASDALIFDTISEDALSVSIVIQRPITPVAVEFDHASKRCIGAKAADPRSSRIQLFLNTLAAIDANDEEMHGTLLNLTDDSSYYIRWEAMRCLVSQAEPQVWQERLEALAASDSCRQVRTAAQQMIAMLEENV